MQLRLVGNVVRVNGFSDVGLQCEKVALDFITGERNETIGENLSHLPLKVTFRISDEMC